MYRTRKAGVANTSYRNWVTLLDSNNSNVSINGSGWGSSITVKLGSVSETFTLPANPNIWNALVGATENKDGSAGYAPKPVAGQQGYVLTGNAVWTDPTTLTTGKLKATSIVSKSISLS
jgi:hypothetical protein